MLDSTDDRSEDERECLAVAKATGMLVAAAVQGDLGKMLAVLGAVTEKTLMNIADPDEREELTLEFLETLAEHMGFKADRTCR